MLLCSQYWATMPIGVPLGRKFTVDLNISYFMKGLSERSIFNVVRLEIFVPVIILEPGDHPFQIYSYVCQFFR